MTKYIVSVVIITLIIIIETFYPLGEIIKYWVGIFGTITGYAALMWYLYSWYKIISKFSK